MARRGTSDPDGEKGADASRGPGRFSYEGLDRVIHEKARLGILASLAARDGTGGGGRGGDGGGVLFNDLKAMCSLTDGNLSRHLTVLTEAGLIEVWKGVAGDGFASGGRPQSRYRLTAAGRRRFAEYISVLERVVADAQAEDPRAATDRPSGTWSPA